jgi:hypothetical protein
MKTQLLVFRARLVADQCNARVVQRVRPPPASSNVAITVTKGGSTGVQPAS